MIFSRPLSDLSSTSKKSNIVRYLRNNFKEGVHFTCSTRACIKHGGGNKCIYMLTDSAFDLINSTYNRRSRYIVESGSITNVNLLLPIQTQTLGFVSKCFNEIYTCIHEYKIGKYRVDLCFYEMGIVLECDENDHSDRDEIYELQRELFIISNGYKLIRFNPNDTEFTLCKLFNVVNKYLHGILSDDVYNV
jgi:hypothetical protein